MIREHFVIYYQYQINGIQVSSCKCSDYKFVCQIALSDSTITTVGMYFRYVQNRFCIFLSWPKVFKLMTQINQPMAVLAFWNK